MAQWFRNVFAGRGETKQRGGGGWQIFIGRVIRLSVPPGLPPETKWETWGRLQLKVFSLIQQSWPESHIYIRFNAFPPGYFGDKLGACPFEIITPNKREEVFLLPDCRDRAALETVFSVLGMVPFTRCAFILDQQPANWREVVASLFEATQKIAKKQPATKYDFELSMCHCLCYSISEDLVIGKIDIPESEVIKILEGVAKEERISLKITRR